MNSLFIYEERINNLLLCDKIIDFQKKSNNKSDGLINYDGIPSIKKSIKNSIDLCLSENDELFQEYVKELQLILNSYINKYKYCDLNAAWSIIQMPNIQYYPVNGGYYEWHCERDGGIGIAASRHLSFITYLNDVTDGGETEFFYQKIKIKPKKGLTIIFPADWTFTHRGIPSKSQEKWIVTGWLNFIE